MSVVVLVLLLIIAVVVLAYQLYERPGSDRFVIEQLQARRRIRAMEETTIRAMTEAANESPGDVIEGTAIEVRRR